MTGGGEIKYDDLPPEYLNSSNAPGQGISKPLPAAPFSPLTPIANIDSEYSAIHPKEITEEQNEDNLDISKLHDMQLPEQGVNLTQFIEQLENSFIMQALNRTGNNKNQAARLLGLNRTTLVERIKKRRLVPLNSPSKEL